MQLTYPLPVIWAVPEVIQAFTCPLTRLPSKPRPSTDAWRPAAIALFIPNPSLIGNPYADRGTDHRLRSLAKIRSLDAARMTGSDDETSFVIHFVRSSGIVQTRGVTASPPSLKSAWKNPNGVSRGRRSQDLTAARLIMSRHFSDFLDMLPSTAECRRLGIKLVRRMYIRCCGLSGALVSSAIPALRILTVFSDATPALTVLPRYMYPSVTDIARIVQPSLHRRNPIGLHAHRWHFLCTSSLSVADFPTFSDNPHRLSASSTLVNWFWRPCGMLASRIKSSANARHESLSESTFTQFPGPSAVAQGR